MLDIVQTADFWSQDEKMRRSYLARLGFCEDFWQSKVQPGFVQSLDYMITPDLKKVMNCLVRGACRVESCVIYCLTTKCAGP